MSVRVAEYEDLPRVAALCARGIEELEDVLLGQVNHDKLFERIKFFWSQAPCLLYEVEGEIVGIWGLNTLVPFYSDTPFIGDYMFYILPEHRSFKVAKIMCEAVKSVSHEFGMPVELNYMVPEKVPQKQRLFEMMKFRTTGIKGVYNGRRR